MHDISLVFLDPTEEFVNAYLEILIDAERDGITLKGCPLFNSVINDDHFSAVGSEVWASSVGRRVALLLKRDGIGDARNRETRRAKGTTVVPEKGSAIRGISRPSDLSARSRDRSNPAVLGGDETVATRPGVARTNGACSHPVSHQSVRTLSIRTFGGALPIIPPSGVTPIGVTS
jgi:hypothetical protein